MTANQKIYCWKLAACYLLAGFLVHSSQELHAQCIAPPSGLISWWRGEGSGVDSADGNTGVLQGGVVFGAGKVGQAMVFNTTNSAVMVPRTRI